MRHRRGAGRPVACRPIRREEFAHEEDPHVRRRRGGSEFGGWSLAERREADLFFSELLGQPAGQAKATESEAEFISAGRWTGAGREPFYGDEPDERWKVVARPGSRIADDLRDDDLVVYRSFRFRGSAWRGILVADPGQRFTLP